VASQPGERPGNWVPGMEVERARQQMPGWWILHQLQGLLVLILSDLDLNRA